MNVRHFHTMSCLDLLYLREALENKVEVDSETRNKSMSVGDSCTLTFLEFGLSLNQDSLYDMEFSSNLEYNYSVNENLFCATNEVLLLKERDADSHCRIWVPIEPSDMSRQEKRPCLSEEGKKN